MRMIKRLINLILKEMRDKERLVKMSKLSYFNEFEELGDQDSLSFKYSLTRT